MSNNNDHLLFPSGRPVFRIKQDAKALRKEKGITPIQALNELTRINGLNLDWDEALRQLPGLDINQSGQSRQSPVDQPGDRLKAKLQNNLSAVSEAAKIGRSVIDADKEPRETPKSLPQEDYIDHQKDMELICEVLKKGSFINEQTLTVPVGELRSLHGKTKPGLAQQLERIKNTKYNLNKEMVVVISINQLVRCPILPEEPGSDLLIDRLAKDIRSKGIKVPLIVRYVGERYEVVCGSKRWKAALKAGLKKVPVILRRLSDKQVLETARSENMHLPEH